MKHLFLFMVAFLIIGSTTQAQYELKSPVPVDPTLRTGVLENGLTYYIKHNQEPKERASFYIIQNVGAILEDDSQNGLAHFLEHMAFNGTKNFPDKGIINTLEQHGVAFGRNINAYTSQNETVYNLSNVPVGPEGLIDTCLLILHDWSNHLLLTEEEIDNERGVISEEWRTRRNASFRVRSQTTPVLLNNSKYGKRDVIGDLNVIKNFEYDEIRRFYHDWYRTDLQAIAVVGDFDVDEMEVKVKELFSKIEAVDNPKERYEIEIDDRKDPAYVLVTDKENTQSSIQLYVRHKSDTSDKGTHTILKKGFYKSLISTMANARIKEMLQKGNPPFINGSIGFMDYPRNTEMISVSTTAKENEEALAFETILIEAERIKRFGFTQSELDRAKTSMLLGYENYYKQREKINHNKYCEEIAELYLTNSPMPGIEYEFEFAKATIPAITTDEILDFYRSMYADENNVVIITGPEKDGIAHLNEEEALSLIQKVKNSNTIEAYVDEVVSSTLVESLPVEGTVIAEKALPEFDAVEWTLSNNTKVVYRFADYNKNKVSLSSYSKGGSSLYGVEDIPTINLSGSFIGTFGLGDFSATALQKALTGKSASVNFSINELSESIDGGCRPEDFETMMQLAYLRFENPRFDKQAYDTYMQRNVAYIANIGSNPKKIMQDSVGQILSNYHERSLIFDIDFLNSASFERMETIYKERFNNAADFTFFIVGDIEKETAKALAAKYLGAIRSSDEKENWVDHKVNGPKGYTKKRIPLEMAEPKATVQIYYDNTLDYTPANRITMSFINEILNLRYTESIREKEGGTYGVRVRASTSHYPTPEGNVSISFDCDPERANDLIPLVYLEIDMLINENAQQDDIDKARKNMLKNRIESKENNGYWMGNIKSYYVHGINMNLEENYEDIIKEMDAKQIKKLAKKFFKNADRVEIVFEPKN